ncbi:MAG: porphobilinogen synthase [Cellulosilyticaceae bacterium]
MIKRPRRLRNSALTRNLVAQTNLELRNLVYPLFVVEGENIKEEISSLKGVYHFSIDQLEKEIKELLALGIHYVILFGVPSKKDAFGSDGYNPNGIVQKAVKAIKTITSEMFVITDVCMCQYTDHGHCGVLDEDGFVNNDKSLEYLAKIALSHVEAGADMVAPSDMMDGRVLAMRNTLDKAGYENVPIMAYSAKYASSFYGPFREAAHSAPAFGDRKTYQMDSRNSDEAVREVALDIEEGADIVMVKPALSYLDIIRRIKDTVDVPVAAYQVSGEYAMLKMAIEQGILDENVMMESMIAIKRAGADIIITYFAKEIALKLRGEN